MKNLRLKAHEAKKISSTLTSWGQQNFKRYPWRITESLWLGFLAEVLLQRTNVEHVVRRWDQVSTKFPTAQSVLRASKEELLWIDSRFGLDRRSRTVVELARFFDDRSECLSEYNSLVGIHGVGHYTAAAFLSLHSNKRAVLMDANVARWLVRFFALEKPNDLRKKGPLWELAEILTPKLGFREYNYALLDFTMTVCTRARPNCQNCVVSKECKWVR